jgi:hypothetical protein
MENKPQLPKDYSEFAALYPDAKPMPFFDSLTTKSYCVDGCFWMFDNSDGHLVCVMHMATHTTLYECECIKKGKELLREM